MDEAEIRRLTKYGFEGYKQIVLELNKEIEDLKIKVTKLHKKIKAHKEIKLKKAK